MRVVIVKFVAERVLALERKKETVFLFDFFGSEFDGKFEFLELDDHVVFLCPGADFVHHVERIENIDDEDLLLDDEDLLDTDDFDDEE